MQRHGRFFSKPNNRHSLRLCEVAFRVTLACFGGWLWISGNTAFAQAPSLLDKMDGDQVSLQPRQDTSGLQIVQHGIDRQHYRNGTGAEFLRFVYPGGKSAQFAYKIPRAPVINEFRVAATISTNRPGAHLAALVTLPRSRHPESGQPIQIPVRSPAVGRGGQWEVLAIDHLPSLLAQAARVARVQYGNSIDERGAYITQFSINVPGGPGITHLIVDQVEVFGIASSSSIFTAPSKPKSPSNPLAKQSNRRVQREQDVPQIIQWQGEPFEFLAKLKFDTIGMSRLPTKKEIQEARNLGLALVCPPPTPQQLTSEGISEELADVLAWDLGSQLTASDLENAIRWQRLIERHDTDPKRTSFLSPQLHTRESSRISDTLLFERGMLGTDTTLHEYSTWLIQRNRVARPGAKIWTAINTQYSPQLARQMTAFQMDQVGNTVASYQQLVSLCSAASSARSRGFYFRSENSLNQTDPRTLLRAKSLELNNLRLQVIEPWLASGKLQATARSSKPDVTALVFQKERSQLLIPVNWGSTMRSQQSSRVDQPTSFLVPGIAESAEAYLVTLGGTQRIRKRRVTGGIKISPEQLPSDAIILLTDDPQAFTQISRFLSDIAPRATQLRSELAQLRLQDTVQVAKSLNVPSPTINSLLSQAKGELQNSLQSREHKSYDLAYQQADLAEIYLSQCEQLLMDQSTPKTRQESFNSTPSFGVAALPTQVQIQKQLNRSAVGNNLLAGGGFENLQQLLQSGWRHQQLPIKDIATKVQLSPEAAHSGSYCLELSASSTNPAAPAPVVASSPVWITSPPLRVRAGEIVEITGVARVPKPLIGSVDGLQIIDSLGGVDMSLRIPEAPSWKPFRLVRAAAHDTEVTVSIALTGLGKAQVDDLAIRTIPQTKLYSAVQAVQVGANRPR